MVFFRTSLAKAALVMLFVSLLPQNSHGTAFPNCISALEAFIAENQESRITSAAKRIKYNIENEDIEAALLNLNRLAGLSERVDIQVKLRAVAEVLVRTQDFWSANKNKLSKGLKNLLRKISTETLEELDATDENQSLRSSLESFIQSLSKP